MSSQLRDTNFQSPLFLAVKNVLFQAAERWQHAKKWGAHSGEDWESFLQRNNKSYSVKKLCRLSRRAGGGGGGRDRGRYTVHYMFVRSAWARAGSSHNNILYLWGHPKLLLVNNLKMKHGFQNSLRETQSEDLPACICFTRNVWTPGCLIIGRIVNR